MSKKKIITSAKAMTANMTKAMMMMPVRPVRPAHMPSAMMVPAHISFAMKLRKSSSNIRRVGK